METSNKNMFPKESPKTKLNSKILYRNIAAHSFVWVIVRPGACLMCQGSGPCIHACGWPPRRDGSFADFGQTYQNFVFASTSHIKSICFACVLDWLLHPQILFWGALHKRRNSDIFGTKVYILSCSLSFLSYNWDTTAKIPTTYMCLVMCSMYRHQIHRRMTE